MMHTRSLTFLMDHTHKVDQLVASCQFSHLLARLHRICHAGDPHTVHVTAAAAVPHHHQGGALRRKDQPPGLQVLQAEVALREAG